MAEMDKEATRIITRMTSLEGERESWETLWQDISDYILQRKSSINTVEPQGEERLIRIHDTTAVRANEKFAAGLYGYLTPPDKQWAALEAENPEMQKIPEVRDWFSRVSERVMRALANSNFQEEIHESYLQIGSFGTSCLYLQEGAGGELIFKDIPIGRYFIAEDENGLVDTLYRRFPYTARQAVMMFGEDNLPKEILDIYRDPKGGESEREFIFIHAIEPRIDPNPNQNDNLNMPFRSTWVSSDYTKVVRESGFNEKAFFVTRYLKSNVEIYGRSAGTAHLPDVKQLNMMEKTIIKQVEKLVDPPILIPDDGVTNYKFRSAPNSVNYWKATNPANKPEPFFVNGSGNLTFGEEKIEQKRNTIREAFHNDFFQAITNVDRQMTATEIMERVEEKIVMFSPTMGRLQTELYSPMLERVFAILYRRGNEFPPVPQALADDPRFKVVFTGKISQALKMIENKATLQTMDQILPFAEQKPEILDMFDFDAIGRKMGINNGMPADFFRPEKQVEAIRKARAEAEQARQQAEVQQMQSQALQNTAGAQAQLQA